MPYISRINSLKEMFDEEFQTLMVTNLNNIRYLCGFSGSNGVLLITKNQNYFFTDFRYQEQSEKEIKDTAKIVIIKTTILSEVFKKINQLRIKKLGIETSLSLGLYLGTKDYYKHHIAHASGLVEELRQIKQKDEIKYLSKAFSIADEALSNLVKVIRPGMSELHIAAQLEFFMKILGSQDPSFKTIVASGPNSSCPHAIPSSRKIKKGDMLKIDFGAMYNGYHSDMTRTVFIGKATEKFKKIYSIVLEAQSEAMKSLKPGAICSEVDAIARNIIDKAGYKENFGHGLGHSLGLDVHEHPSLSSKCTTSVKAGMIFTIEPGIYIPKWGGIRIEDVFLVKEKGLKKFTHFPNSLTEINVD